MESKDLRTLVDCSCCLKTPLEEMMMRPVLGVVPKGCQGSKARLVPREKKETRASLV